MKLTKMQQLLAGVGIIIFVIVITNFLFLKGDRQKIRGTERRIAKLRQDINVANQIKQSAAVLEEEMTNLEAQLERLKKILPVSVNEPKLVADLKRFANENGIEITQISRHNSIRDDVIIEIPYAFDTVGNYHDYGRFFAKLTSYQRILNVKALHLVTVDDMRSNQGLFIDKDYSVWSTFVISVYIYREPTEEELREQYEAKKKAMSKKG